MDNPEATSGPNWPWNLAVFILIAVAILRVASTWSVFSATFDESSHLASGMEWLDKGTYTYDLQHPPLARALIAILPWLRGLRSHLLPNILDEGNAILYSTGNPATNLAAARAGNLPFLLLACVVVFLWARRWFGRLAGLFAVLLFVCLPPVLGQAGLATLDMASAATVALALYAFLRCIENPDWRRLAGLAVSVALAFLCKYSSVVFLPACFLGGSLCLILSKRPPVTRPISWQPLARRVALVGSAAVILTWAGFGFSLQPRLFAGSSHRVIDRVFGKVPPLRTLALKAVSAPMPLGQFVDGLQAVRIQNGRGIPSYLRGEFRRKGWWYFFPLLIGLKTPVGFLILVACGIFAMARNPDRNLWQQHLTLIFPLLILCVCMMANLNMGIRHVLAIYPPLAVIAGAGVSKLLVVARQRSRFILLVPILLVAWVVVDSWIARPDYLAYFNGFAGRHPENITVGSDLDWGQDLKRLSDRLRQLGVRQVTVKYFGTAPLDKAGLPPYTVLTSETVPVHGYLAVSVLYLKLDNAKNGGFEWLKGRKPQEIVGKSIYLYNLED